MAVLPNPGNIAPARSTSSRRASSAFAAPAPALDKPKTGRVTKKRVTAPVPIPKAPKDDSFVSGDMFDFVGKFLTRYLITPLSIGIVEKLGVIFKKGLCCRSSGPT